VITIEGHQGKRYGAHLMHHFRDFLSSDSKHGFGMLFCSDKMIPFYSQFGWVPFDGKVSFRQPGGSLVWKSNTMFLNDVNLLKTKHLDLQGLPW
jgi:hypothetical protein